MRSNTTNRISPNRRPRDRGIAMMLVLVAITVGTVVAAAALVSTDNSHAMGKNAIQHSAAEWSAQGVSELVVAAMQTETQWEDLMVGDTLLDNFTFAGSEVDVRVTALDGSPVTSEDREILLQIESKSGVIKTQIIKQVSLADDAIFGEEIDTDLGEFGIYAIDQLTMFSNARVQVWAKSPEAAIRNEVKIGTASDSSNDINITSTVKLDNVKLYVKETASSGLRYMVKDTKFSGGGVLPDIVPVIPVYLEEEDLGLYRLSMDFSASDGKSSNFPGQLWINNYSVRNYSTLIIDEAFSPRAAVNDLIIDRGTLKIRGHVRLIIHDDFTMQNGGAIEIAEDSSLTLFIGNDLFVSDSVIGADRNILKNSTRSEQDITDYTFPGNIRIYSTPRSQSNGIVRNWTFQNRSVVLASIHAPIANVNIMNDTTFIGRLTAETVSMSSNSSLHYDPAFDNRMGFTDPDSPVYSKSQEIREEYVPVLKFLKTVASSNYDDLEHEERALTTVYSNTRDKGLFIREFSSALLGQNFRKYGDTKIGMFDQVATKLSGWGYSPTSIKFRLNSMLTGFKAGHDLNIDLVKVNETTITELLGGPAPKEDGGDGTEISQDDIPHVDDYDPEANGHYVRRRGNKARSRSIWKFANHFEGRW